jgi:hypothetical protein
MLIGVAVPLAPFVGPAAPAAAGLASSSKTIITGGTVAQRAELRAILKSLGGTQITSVRISSSPKGVSLFMEPAGFASTLGEVVPRVMWDAQLTAHAFAQASRTHGFAPVTQFSVFGAPQMIDPSSTRVLPSFDRKAIVPPVGQALKRAGARLIEFNLFRTPDPAFAVVVVAADPARFIKRRLAPIIDALNRATARTTGVYIAVTDARHSVVFAYALVDTSRSRSTSLYVRPDLVGCAELLPVENEVAPEGAPPCPQG